MSTVAVPATLSPSQPSRIAAPTPTVAVAPPRPAPVAAPAIVAATKATAPEGIGTKIAKGAACIVGGAIGIPVGTVGGAAAGCGIFGGIGLLGGGPVGAAAGCKIGVLGGSAAGGLYYGPVYGCKAGMYLLDKATK